MSIPPPTAFDSWCQAWYRWIQAEIKPRKEVITVPFVLETLRAEYRRRFGPSVRFTDKCGQFRIGDWVRFDCQSTKEGGRIIATYKVGQVADLLERDDVAGRICELIIVVPEVPDLDGRIAVPSKLYRRPVHSATRHGGPGHAAEQ